MTNFFLNLASRVADHENAIRPRIAGRFESSEPAAVLAEINEEIAIGPDAPLIAPDTRQVRRESGMAGLRPAAEPPVHAAPPLLSPPAGSPQRNPAAIDAPQSGPAIMAPPASSAADRGESQSTPLPAMTLHVPNTHDAELPQRKAKTLVEQDRPVRKQTVVSLPAAQLATTGSDAAESQNAPIVNAAASHRSATGVLARETFVARKAREMPRPADAVPPPETVVHVTIGRVELRAPATAAPRKREQAPSQVGTLAEYLQKHAARTRP